MTGPRRRPLPRARQNMRRDATDSGDPAPEASWWGRLRESALTVPDGAAGVGANPLDFWARAAFWLFLAYYGWFYATRAIYRSQTKVSVVDYIIGMADLVFHEAGHIILAPLGSFMSTLGGSLFQVLIPAVCLVAFLRQRNGFAAAAMLWWAGQNLVDVAPYINDARAQRLVLLGGVTGRDVPGYHDWNNLLSRLGWLEYDQTFASAAHVAGVTAIALGLAWSAYWLLLLRRAQGS